MVHDRWHDFHRLCVDKVTAKDIASRLAPNIRTAKTIALLDMHAEHTIADVKNMLQPYVGRQLVAKPAHSCGGFLDLSRPLTPKALTDLHSCAVADYFYTLRETQYLGLPRRIIVEENLGGEAAPNEYKFHCVFGQPLMAQIDIGRFGDHRRALVLADDFRWRPGNFGAPPFAEPPQQPPTWDAMMQLTRELCRPFDFVRIDLYDTPDGIFFSEFTFTPSAGTGFARHPDIRLLFDREWQKRSRRAHLRHSCVHYHWHR